MAISEVINSVSDFMNTCKKNMSKAATKIRSKRRLSKFRLTGVKPQLCKTTSLIPVIGSKKRVTDDHIEKKIEKPEETKVDNEEHGVEEEDNEGVIWRKTILMGEKCQPLDFSGVIYYDSKGRQMSEIPTPRTPLRSPLHSFAPH